MRQLLVITRIIIPAFLVTSCTNDVGVPGACFNQKVKPIIISNCTSSGCHNSQDQAGDIDLTSYGGVLSIVDPGHPLRSELYKVVRGQGEEKMPPDHDLSKEDIQAIKGWISAGAKEDDCRMISCDSSRFSYSQQVQPILKNNCLGCHASGRVQLNSYAQVRNLALSGALAGSVRHEAGYRAMPEGYRLSDCNISTITRWVVAGAPDN